MRTFDKLGARINIKYWVNMKVFSWNIHSTKKRLPHIDVFRCLIEPSITDMCVLNQLCTDVLLIYITVLSTV